MNGRRLYEEIGGVDERYLQQAAAYRARRNAPAWRALLIAAALTLIGALLLCTIAASVTIGVLVGILGEGEEPTPPAPMEQMELAMQEAQQTHYPRSADEVEPMLFYQPMLIWSEQGSDVYYTVSLSTSECEQLILMMQSKNRTEFTEQSQAPKYQIWLSFGDGVVVSPYLKNTAGNAGHGEVFDYDPELELGDALAERIARYIET